jgi:hypothetical protein
MSNKPSPPKTENVESSSVSNSQQELLNEIDQEALQGLLSQEQTFFDAFIDPKTLDLIVPSLS